MGAALVTFMGTVGVVTAPPVAAATPEQMAAADGLASFLGDTLSNLADLQQLSDAIPGTDLVPGSSSALDLAETAENAADSIFDDLAAAVNSVVDKSESNVEDALNNLTNIGPIDTDIDVDVDVSNGTITFNTLTLSRAITDAPLAFSDGEIGTADYFSLEGGSLAGDLSLDLASSGPLVLSVDPTSGQVTGLDGPVPDALFAANLALAGSFTARLGILDVTAAAEGPTNASLNVAVQWLDPDNSGVIEVYELVNSGPDALFAATTTGGEVHLDVSLTSTLSGLGAATGTVELHDTDLTNGLDAPTFTLGELGNFTNMTPQDVLAAIAQLAIWMRGAQLKLGNQELPLIDENLAELGSWNEGIGQFFVDHQLSLAENPLDLDVTADKLEDEGLQTIEQIIDELTTSLGLTDLGLAYNGNDDAVTFTIETADEIIAPAPTAAVNVANELAPAGITGLVLDGGASLTIAPSYSLSLTVGLDLSDPLADPSVPITDRIFIDPVSGPEFTFDVPISGDLDLKGIIGFLEIDLVDSEAGAVDLLVAADDTKPMLAVDLAGSRLSLTDLFDATGAIETTNPNPGEFHIDLGDGNTILATANLSVPEFSLDVSTSLGGVDAASAGLTFAWPNLFVGSPQVTTTGDFDDDFLSFNLDNEDPLALFSTILQGVEAVFGALHNLDQQGGDAGDLLNEELPFTSTSLEDAVAFIAEVRDALNAMASNPAGSLQKLELQANAIIAGALDKLDGTVDLTIPELPDKTDFVTGTGGDAVFDETAYEAALAAYLVALQDFVGDSADFLGISYVPGNSPGALILDFDIGVCSDKADHAGCAFEYPITQPFNLNLDEFGGGLVGADASGEVAVDYGVVLSADFGIELPEVTSDNDDDGLPEITGSPELFLLDTTGLTADIAGTADGEISASIGPFEVQIGDVGGEPESNDAGECTDGTPGTDDDNDGIVNDGCPAIGVTEAGISDTSCTNEVDEEEDFVEDDPETEDTNEAVPADGEANDGCPAVANPMQAKAGVALSVTNDFGDPGPGDRLPIADIGTFVSGLDASATPASGVNCGAGDVLACAELPAYVSVGSDTEYLGTITFSQADFDSSPTLSGEDVVFNALKDKAEGFLWSLIGEGITQFGTYLSQSLDSAEYGAEIPVIGDAMDAGADVGAKFGDLIADVGTLVGSLDSAGDFNTIRSEIQGYFWDGIGPDSDADLLLNFDDVVDDGDASAATTPIQSEDIVVTLLCGNDDHDCDDADGDTLLDLRDVQVEFKMGQVAGGHTPAFDFGIPGLRISGGDGTVSSTVSWQLNVGFGISLEDGFYLLTERSVDAADAADGSAAGEELSLHAVVDLGGEPETDGGVPTVAASGGETGVPNEDLVALQGDIAFIGVDIFNAKHERIDAGETDDADLRDAHELDVTLSLDIPNPSASDTRLSMSELVTGLDPTDWNVMLDATVDLWATLVTSIDFGDPTANAAIPRLLADLSLEWEITGDFTEGVTFGDLTAGFGNVRLDLGSFFAEFLGPVLAEVQNVTKPLQPIIDTLQAPIPGVSQLAELVGADPITLLSLMEALSDSDLTLIKRLLQVITFVNNLPSITPGDPDFIVPLGSFGLDSTALSKPELPSNEKGNLISGDPAAGLDAAVKNAGGVFGSTAFDNAGDSDFQSTFAEATDAEDGGFTFPAFQNPSQLFGLLVGENPTLIRFDAGLLRAEVSESFSFGPITIGPVPVSVVVSIGAAVEGRFAMGYDTKGIRQMVQNLTDEDPGNDGFFENLGVLFAGVFIDDLDQNGVDVPEIRLVLEAAVGAAVDLVVVKAGVEAGLRATLDLNLHDGGWAEPQNPENLDGKLRIDEIIEIIRGNPICLFDVSGKLEAFIRLFVTIDLFLFSATFKQTIVNIVLLELDNITKELCEPPPPVLAGKSGNVLVLNMGERADQRNYDEENEDEKFTIRQLSEGSSGVKVSVTAFGIVQEYTGIDKVVGSGWTGKDSIVTEEGGISGICQSDGTVDPPIGLTCEEGDADPGDTVTKSIAFNIPVDFCGGAKADTLGGGLRDDTLRGDGKLNVAKNACVEGDSGDDGNDKITGGAGADTIWGDDLDDDLNGEAGDDTIHGGDGIDQITGGLGKDTLNGNDGDDVMLGGPEEDPCKTGDDADRDLCSDAADDTMNGGDGADRMEGDHGKDNINGGFGDDIIVGGLGDDTANGSFGDDQIFGNQGDDTLNGGFDDDDLVGGVGDDTLNGSFGEDDLLGEDGVDTLNGGFGNDVLLGDSGEINRGPGPVDGFTRTDLEKPLVTLIGTTGGAGDFLNGGGDADRIFGQEGADEIHGNGGDDIVHGNGGADTISGDEGADTLHGDEGGDTIHGDDETGSHGASDLVDIVRGGPGNDTIEGNADGDLLHGDTGEDTIFGDADDAVGCPTTDGQDTIHGGPDDDYLFGNADDDDIFGDGGDDRIVGGSDDEDVCDGSDTISGGTGDDVVAGDNSIISDNDVVDDRVISTWLDDEGAGDVIHGDTGDDRILGQYGDDELYGDTEADYVEGNEGDDTISGGDGNDDLIGGSSANDGDPADGKAVNNDSRSGNGRGDVHDEIHGDSGQDWIAGDNALINRNVEATGRAPIELFDVGVVGSPVASSTSGPDDLFGDGADDRIFGQGKGDTIRAGTGDDYVEGNDGDDTIYGEDGNDDLVGGGSANDGVIDEDRVGDTLLDVGELLIDGGDGEDYITGDNALVDRNVTSSLPDSVVFRLFDVHTVDETAADPGTHGGEVLITGGDGPDWIFGQGGNDTIKGDEDAEDYDAGQEGDDYVEGNEGDDAISGNAGADDLVGGSSADDGIIDGDRVGNGLRDGGETLISGGTGIDWITGDNALVNRNRPTDTIFGRAPIELFDVELAGGPAISTETSGGDFITGDEDEDRIYGQGNGAQPLTQTDPADTRNNDFITSGGDSAHGDFDRDTGTTDEDAAGWLGDVIHGGTGDDEIEGNHGNDVIFGNAPGAAAPAANDDEDDIVGGGSADDGRIFYGERENVGANLLDGADTIHGDEADATRGDDDVVLGDNGWIRRTGDVQAGADGPDAGETDAVSLPVRTTETGLEPPPGTFGDDYIAGNGGHDDIIGQAGDDALNGEYGSDGIVGDLGTITVDLLGNGGEPDDCGPPGTIEPNEPFISEVVCQPGTLFRRVELFRFDDTKANVVAGADVILGGDGDDWIHGGPGADLINGDGDGGEEIVDPDFTYTQSITDPNPASADFDRIFGGDSNGAGQTDNVLLGDGDNLWGGRGHDHLYGGHGADNQDVRPAPGDPYPDTWEAWAQADVESYHGVDFIYGGHGPDAAQANVADNGPVTGDRIMDWAGVFNLSLLCPATYGAYVTIRDQSPDMIKYWVESADFDGVTNVETKGSSGFNELAMVYKPDIKSNNNPPYPNTPGHFFACGP